MYSPTAGRFINRDPIGFADGWGLYASYFTPNSIDPSGYSCHAGSTNLVHRTNLGDVWLDSGSSKWTNILDYNVNYTSIRKREINGAVKITGKATASAGINLWLTTAQVSTEVAGEHGWLNSEGTVIIRSITLPYHVEQKEQERVKWNRSRLKYEQEICCDSTSEQPPTSPPFPAAQTETVREQWESGTTSLRTGLCCWKVTRFMYHENSTLEKRWDVMSIFRGIKGGGIVLGITNSESDAINLLDVNATARAQELFAADVPGGP